MCIAIRQYILLSATWQQQHDRFAVDGSARHLERDRFAVGGSARHLEGAGHIACNADMDPAEGRKFCALDETGKNLMQSAMSQLQLSARGYHRVLKLAHTIADLAGSESIGPRQLVAAFRLT